MSKFFSFLITAIMAVSFSDVFSASSMQSAFSSGTSGPYPYLIKGTSSKSIVETARDHQWSINFNKRNSIDTLNIIAIRVQFKKDTSSLTTGNGLFFTYSNLKNGDLDEYNNYYKSDTIYPFDRLPHDSLYFEKQLELVKSYYKKVSHGKFVITSRIYPLHSNETGYEVPYSLPAYSPAAKKKNESYNDYYNRKNIGLIKFIKDAIIAANGSKLDSPFANITFNNSDNTYRDELGRKTAFLIIHSGVSYLTDGGDGRVQAVSTPSDLIDGFINSDFFKYYRDTLGIKANGITVQGKNGDMLLDEVMMCPETSNQDGVNWGIQGILVNQIARQLGIPDLFSTSSGTSAVGSFCIMDFAGYSAGKGFIPPYPSAWVRAFMGWDNVKVASLGSKKNYSLKALTSVIDRDLTAAVPADDTTILLVPINDKEYYLLENRQRNLSGNPDLFKYDSVDHNKIIGEYPNNVDIAKNVVVNTQGNPSAVISKVNNNDVSLSASGVLVWHIDERIIQNRLATNYVNADSLYRGISLVEADGVNDLGITFSNAFYSALYDYGGAEDIFPHKTKIDDTVFTVDSLGPYILPSTRANDGGHTYLTMKIATSSPAQRIETYYSAKNDGDHYISNFSDSTFIISLSWNYLTQSWPKRAVPEQFFEPLVAELDAAHSGREFFLISKSGRMYAWPSDSSVNPYNKKTQIINRSDLRGNIIQAADTIAICDSLPPPAAMPSSIANAVYIPSTSGKLYIVNSLSGVNGAFIDTLTLPFVPSTYLCNFSDSSWAIGCNGGRIVYGQNKTIDAARFTKLPSDSSVTAIAAIRELNAIAVMQSDGTLSLCRPFAPAPDSFTTDTTGIGPYTLVTGDLDKDNASEIVVSDSRHGIWVYNRNMKLSSGWEKEPNDMCNVYSYTPENVKRTGSNRSLFPVNNASPSLADINRDGYLDIVAGGSNGIYALNYKGVLIYNWPSYLDTKYWYQRGVINSTPIVVTGKDREPLVLFSSSTGENATFAITKILKADKSRGTIWYTKQNGEIDSIWDLKSSEIDTLLTFGDSLVLPYVLPGGYIDAVNSKAKRPSSVIQKTYQSNWPLTTGGAMSTSPLAAFTGSSTLPDLFGATDDGWIYRWQLPKEFLPDTLFWAQCGFDPGRSFAYNGTALVSLTSDKEPLAFFSYPNPAVISRNLDQVVFRYKFNGTASKVRLDIYTYSGFRIYSMSTMGNPPYNLTGSYPDWNELVVPVKDFGPAVYRCRMEATINGKKHSKIWKMAIIK